MQQYPPSAGKPTTVLLSPRGDEPAAAVLAEALRQAGIDPASAGEAASALIPFSTCTDTVIESVVELRAAAPDTRILCVSMADHGTPSAFIWRLLQAGADDSISFHGPAAIRRIAALLERWNAVDTVLRSEAVAGTLIGHSAAWRRLLRQVVEAACFTTAPVLIMGETGTGKELLARLIHDLDNRPSKGELVTVDCTVIVPELSGSELFGHERGAFTGAVQSRDGAFALAHRGTLFLDEAGELPLLLQAQLLRAIQEKTYKRVGGNSWQHTDFRLVCATNRDLPAEVARGAFRPDLYFRLATWVFRPPPLRERRADILPLARHFLAAAHPEGECEFDPAVEEFLLNRDYPGNVRELRQLVTRMGQRHAGPGPVTAGDLPAEEWPAVEQAARRVWPDELFDESIRRGVAQGIELRQISQAASDAAIRITVQQEEGNLQRAAKRLGITDRALQMRRASGQLA